MRTIYLEVVTSKFIPGTSMRDKDVEYVLLDNAPDMSFLETNNFIIEAIKKYAEENNVMLGKAYNNAMTGTNMYQDQHYSTRVLIEKENGYFYQVFIESPVKAVYLNWAVCPNKNWEYHADRNSFCCLSKYL